MKQLTKIAAAAALAVAAASAHAELLLVDDFNTPAVAISGGDTTVNGSAVVVANTALGGGQIATNRLVESNLTENALNLAIPTQVTVGGGANGNLDISNGTGANSIVTVTWTISSFTLPTGPYAVLFSLLFSDPGVPSTTPNTASFSFDGVGANDWGIKNLVLPEAGSPTAAFFDLSQQEAEFLAGGGTLTMTLQGSTSWDLTLDQFSISIPEPTTLALAGLALIGAGLSARRRKV